MTKLRTWLLRFNSLFNRQRHDRELADEIESHLQMHIDDNVRDGMTPEEARRQALIKLGGVEQTKEKYRDRRGISWLGTMLQDTRFGLRILRKSPGFTAVAILTLALGIGATTAMFTVLDGVVLKSLKYPGAERIVAINTRWSDSGTVNPRTTGGDLQDLRGAKDSFEAFSYYNGGEMGVQLSRSADFGGVFLVDPNFFRVFAVPASTGRTFTSEDAGRSAIVSTEFAQRNFGSASAALGQMLAVEGTAYEIVGVMPPLFQFPREAQVWAAVSPTPENINRMGYNYYSVARLRPGLSSEVVNARLLSIANRLAASFPDSNRSKTFTVLPLQEQLAAPVRTTLLLLMGAVALVLLIACANVANLTLARSAVRIRELSVRAALGASRRRLAMQLLSECMVLALAAGFLGIVLALWETKTLLVIGARFLPAPLLGNVHFDSRVLAFALASSFLITILFGIAPAWQASHVDLQSVLKQSDTRGFLGSGQSRLRNSLVIAQIALSLMLAVGAGLLFRTLLALQSSPMGYRSEGILVTYASAPGRTLPEALEASRLFDDLYTRLRRLPGVVNAAGAMGLPAGQYNSDGSFAIEGKQSFSGDLRKLPYAGFRLASPEYFATMRIPLLRGRDFNDGDLRDRPFVVIISE